VGRVRQETQIKVMEQLEALPEDARSKCALCRETLTHVVKKAEAATGAGTATVTRILAELINETAAPADRVTGKSLQDKVRYYEGKDKIGNSENKNPGPWPTCEECGEKEAAYDVRWNGEAPTPPKETFGRYLCFGCRSEALGKKQEELEAEGREREKKWYADNPINDGADKFWKAAAERIKEIIHGAPMGRISDETRRLLNNASYDLDDKLSKLNGKSEPPYT